jgi:protein subunit release factor B
MTKPTFSVTKKDLTITYFSGTGPGGQNRNKNQKCVRIKHNDTGIIKTGQSYNSREQNTKEAFESLCKDKRFLAYCQIKLIELEQNETLEEKVDKMMKDVYMKVEVKEYGRWEVEK